MKNILAAIILVAGFISFGVSAVGQSSLDERLFQAIQSGDAKVVQSLLKKGVSMEIQDENRGRTPLGAAAESGQLEIARLLLEKGAKIDAKDFFGWTALSRAAFHGHIDIVNLLLEKGADIGRDNSFPLLQAAEEGQTEVVRRLLDQGANIESKFNDGTSPLMIAGRGHDDTVLLLLEKGANIEAKNDAGNTVLIETSEFGRVEMVKMLLARGASIYASNNNGRTALLAAACSIYGDTSHRTTVAKLLLERGADAESKDKDGNTALNCARDRGITVMVGLLEEAVRRRQEVEDNAAKNPHDRLASYVAALQQHPQNDRLREKIIQLAASLPEAPPVPEEARQLFVEASSLMKQASSPQALVQPIGLLRKSLEIAPWWANAYFNLSRALELSGQYDEAAMQLNYYLKLNPSEADARSARAHLVVIQTKKDTASGKQQ